MNNRRKKKPFSKGKKRSIIHDLYIVNQGRKRDDSCDKA